jgi:hypothetical protein
MEQLEQEIVYYSQYSSIVISDKDLLWVGRGCVGEGLRKLRKIQGQEKIRAMCWSLINRCLLHPAFVKRNWTYGKMWCNFSQPIKEAWTKNGRFCKPGGKYYGSKYCTEAKLKRRDKIRSLSFNDFPGYLISELTDLKNGKMFPPDCLAELVRPRISNWSDITEQRKGKHIYETYPWGKQIGGEWFFESSNLLTGWVKVRQRDEKNKEKIIG